MMTRKSRIEAHISESHPYRIYQKQEIERGKKTQRQSLSLGKDRKIKIVRQKGKEVELKSPYKPEKTHLEFRLKQGQKTTQT